MVKRLPEWYNKKITNASFSELKKFVEWCNKFYGYYPIIIGGWAVWAYTKRQKSRDIDVVLPTNQFVQSLITPYCIRNDFKQTGLITKEVFKEIKIGKETHKIYLDACSYQNKNALKENRKIEVSWNLLEKHSVEWSLGKTKARIPAKELLLIMKVKALRDRLYDLKNSDLGTITKSFLESKIEKDKQDIQELLRQGIDNELLEKLLEKTKFKKLFDKAVKQMTGK